MVTPSSPPTSPFSGLSPLSSQKLCTPLQVTWFLEGPTVLQIRPCQRLITANLWPLTTHIYHVLIVVTDGFSKKSFYIIFRSSCGQMFFKTSVVRNVAIFTGKQLCWSVFLIKLQALWPATLFQPHPKRDLNTSAFLRILQNFYETASL